MDDKLRCILTKGGLNLQEGNGKERNLSSLLSLLESWLGFSEADDDDDDMVMMEDVEEFDATFYRAVEDFLIDVWKPDERPQHKFSGLGNDDYGDGKKCINSSNNNNALLKETTPSLYNSILSVRVTRILKHWMKLNIGSPQRNNAMYADEEDEHLPTTMLSFQLLKHCSFNVRASNTTKSEREFKFFPLIQSLYQYVEQLPFLQSQIHLFSQSITRGNQNGISNNLNRPNMGLADPHARIAQLQLAQSVKEKLEKEFDDHVKDLECVIGEWYAYGTVEIRRQCRAQLGSVWSTFEARSTGVCAGGAPFSRAGVTSENTSSSGIALTLRVLHRILLGISNHETNRHQKSSLCKSYEHLLFHHLIPLHRPNSMVLWRDQTSLLELYHEPLVQCIAVLLKHRPEWTGRVIEGLLGPDIWKKSVGNTPKLVLLLHEIDTYIGCLPGLPDGIEGTELGDSLPILFRTLGFCMASENSRLAQRALPYVKNKKFVRLIETNLGLSLDILLPFLLRKEPSWNPTVRKMTYNVMVLLRDFDLERFVEIGNRCFANERNHRKQETTSSLSAVDLKMQKGGASMASTNKISLLPTDYTVKSAMGSWTPPTKNDESDRMSSTMPPPLSRRRDATNSTNPPLTVTGVAPWAMGGHRSRSNPPLAVTGVAPWAMKVPKEGTRTTTPRRKHALLGVTDKDTNLLTTDGVSIVVPNKATKRNENRTQDTKAPRERDSSSKSTSCRVLAYMEKIRPPEEEKGISPWSRSQMGESPTLLSTLKFHDLVFGHDLGEGAFGSVRYARLIDRTKTRSHWPEYAVKIIATEKIKTMGYEAPIQREIAILRVLSHPCIARMISSFRFRDGVYLVLEYASKGDLHTFLRTNGSLDHDSTRFITGEVTAALSSIHDIGLGYFDLKPENIVITESGHVKLTDFGGSRPITQAAKKMISESAKNVFRDLRDGDWKVQEKKTKSFDMDDNDTDDENAQDYDPEADLRIEGTTIYLPPEVVLGSFPTLAADSWALGCVLYQCLTGRPPIIEVDETLARNRIVSFDVKNSQNDSENFLFGDSKTANMETAARDLIIQLMDRNVNERPTMIQVAEHCFFQDNDIDVFALWRQPALKLEVGDAKPPPAETAWARRHLSSIWAPQPQSYDISSTDSIAQIRSNDLKFIGPISEGVEAPFYFSQSNILPSVRSASQVAPMPPRKK